MPISLLPDPPSRLDPQSFAARGDAFMGALPTLVVEANELQVDVNAKKELIDTAAATATEKAGIATTKAGEAASSRSAAKTSELLAQDWAIKTGEPVIEGEFSAKHYAQLAAAGMGLPVFATAPTSNVGPIFLVGNGVMEWAGTGYVHVELPLVDAAPVVDIGPVYLVGTGPMEWDAVSGTYVAKSGGATGGGPDKIFYKNGQVMTVDHTIEQDENASATGPLRVDADLVVEGNLVIL